MLGAVAPALSLPHRLASGMRYLPFTLSVGSELKQAIRSADQDPRRRAMCAYCGGTVTIEPDRAVQRVRCPRCWHWQHVSVNEEPPWRLSTDAAAALRQTRRWVRG
ncbi:MAG: hypothetical protein HIU82_11710 [Proteobacteria bacterium]|nr:hypothetical protein [Pseudomonadota bacterium]